MAGPTLKNQERIIAHEKKILRNQGQLGTIIRNQHDIIRNQQAIIKNQKKILASLGKPSK
jgi:hypothetical protein